MANAFDVLVTTVRRAADRLRRQDSRDELVPWMSFACPGMLLRGNVWLFERCIETLPSDAPVIEIGTFAGLSANVLRHLLRRAGRSNPLICVDPWDFEHSAAKDGGRLPHSDVTFAEYRQHVIDSLERNMRLFSKDDLPYVLELSSDAFFAAWGKGEAVTDHFGRSLQLGGPIAMAYIDGAHTLEQSQRDVDNADRWLEVGGSLVLDDSAEGSGWGSMETARRTARLPHFELVARNPNYCLRKTRAAGRR